MTKCVLSIVLVSYLCFMVIFCRLLEIVTILGNQHACGVKWVCPDNHRQFIESYVAMVTKTK